MAEDKKSGVPYIVKLVIGLALMFGGFYVSRNVEIGFQKSLGEQGLPLDLGLTVAVIGVFLILFPVMHTFFFSSLAQAITERTSELEKTFSEAEALRSEMGTLKTDYEARLAATEAAARENIQKQIKDAQDLRKVLMSEAAAKADELVKKASDEIALEKDRVLNAIRLEVVNLTLTATERILGESVDDARNRKLIQEFVDKAEVPK